MLLLIAFVMFALLILSWVVMPETASEPVARTEAAPADGAMAGARA